MMARTHDAPVYTNSGSTASQSRAASALGRGGLGSEKIPKDESEHGEDDHRNRPKNFLSRIRAALKDVDDCPDIGDQNDKPEQTLVLHFLSSVGRAVPKLTRFKADLAKSRTTASTVRG